VIRLEHVITLFQVRTPRLFIVIRGEIHRLFLFFILIAGLQDWVPIGLAAFDPFLPNFLLSRLEAAIFGSKLVPHRRIVVKGVLTRVFVEQGEEMLHESHQAFPPIHQSGDALGAHAHPPKFLIVDVLKVKARFNA
jgi:hypothetical protein